MKRVLSLVPPLVPLVLALLASSCASSNREPDAVWQTHEIEGVPSDRVLWKVAMLAFEKLGFAPVGGQDPSAMVARSLWKNDLSPFSGKGFRTRAELRMRPRGPGRWEVEARVQRQRNEAIVRPTDARYADWKWDPEDVESARILLYHVRSRFPGGGTGGPRP